MHPVTARRPGSRLALLAFVFALVLKSAIPLFASWSAHLQGKAVAEVCDVYGVELPGRGTGALHGTHAIHAMHATHAMNGAAHEPDHVPHRHDPASHSGDHCVLSVLVAFSGGFGDVPALPVAPRRDLLHALAWSADPIGVDAAARWAALLGHGPPAIS